MAKRALPGVELLAIKTPDQLDAARGAGREPHATAAPADRGDRALNGQAKQA